MRKANKKGFTLLYSMVAMTGFCAVISVGVDYGHVQLAKTELRRASDSAARAGASGLAEDPGTALVLSKQYALANKVDGLGLTLQNSDIQIGTWSTSAHTFTALSGTDQYSANAVRILGQHSAARGTAVPVMFGKLLGANSCDVHAEAIAMFTPGVAVDQNVLATANPFLAGMPYGSVASQVNPHHSADYAGNSANPRQSPLAVGMGISQGTSLTFDSIGGTAKHDPNLDTYQPDGDLDDIGHNNLTTSDSNSYTNSYTDQNGISDLRAPINALVGIFLDDQAPNTDTDTEDAKINTDNCPRDYSSADARNMTVYKPALRQTFFIGDGLTDSGVQQNFIAPKGATRLFLATWDYYEWNNNSGNREVKINRPIKITLVK